MEKERKLAIRILGIFEDFLDSKDISIPSKDREATDIKKSEQARIFGVEYFELEDTITDFLTKEMRK